MMKTASSLQRSAVRGSLVTVTSAAVTFPIGVLTTIVVARALGPTPFGRLALLTLLTGTVLPLLDFGFQSSFMQWAAAAEAEGRHRDTAHLLRQRFGWVLLSQAVPMIAVGPIVLHGQPAWIQIGYVVATLGNLIFAGTSLSLAIQNRTASAAWINGLSSALGGAAAISTALALHSASAVWVSRMLPGLLLIPITYRLVDPRLRGSIFRPAWPRNLPPGYWRFALLTWVAIGTGTLVFSRSEAFVMHLYGQNAALGVFALAYGVSSQMTGPLDLVVAPLAPAIAAVSAVDPRRAIAAMLRTTRFFALAAGAFTAVVPAVAALIPAVYGSSYRGAAAFLLPLAAVSTFQSTTNALALSTYARRDGRTLALAHSAALAVDVALAFALIPALHAWGAVIANGASQLVVIGWLLRKQLEVESLSPTRTIKTARSWALGVVAALVASGCGEIIHGAADVHVPAILAIGLASYVLLVRASGGALDQDDCSALSRSLPTPVWKALSWSLMFVGVRSPGPTAPVGIHQPQRSVHLRKRK